MPTRNVVLTDHQAGLVARLVASGRYQNASEVMREGLRLVERQESEDEIRLEAMRKAADAGIADIAAGRFRTFNTADTLADHLTALSAEALADLSSNADTEQ
ncbi:MAG: type II toxin-antitoxin system ParD family antitoxin [Boseongicola sp. SB0676_bin_33]|nr:type II toxin-antitoxin system ParD family antitoxin [Boseongicola sp. SB0676_bin_33]